MTPEQSPKTRLTQALASLTGLILMLVWMEGGFTHKTPPGNLQAAEADIPARMTTAKATRQALGETREWPATVSARSVAQLAPKVAARIVEIPVRTGDAVKAGQIVARLDASEWQARLNQARSTLAAAEAEASRAQADARRVNNLFAQEAATAQQREAAEAMARAAGAQTAGARAAIAEAQAQLDETMLHAPFDGTVVNRELEPGDLAAPGKPVLTVQTAQRLRLEAAIPEACAGDLAVGQALTARMGEAEHEVRVEEIAPAADPQTRTVRIKAGLDARVSTQPGAFAWLRQNCGDSLVLLIPAAAVKRSGQLETVRLIVDGKPVLRHVRTGKLHDGRVEILSGLKEGDEVVTGDAR